MKYLTVLTILIALLISQVALAGENSRLDKVNWEAFSKNLVNGLTMENDGIQQTVLKHIITYGDRLDVRDAVFDIIRIYKFNKDQRHRQMAVVALAKINTRFASYFLKRSIKFEANPTIRRQLMDYVYRQQQVELARQDSRVDKLIAAIVQ